ncbi:Kynurenine 3-monooxygenase [Emticicia aquatica]|uniref:Kynurenine 3-monooxygenase n=1 Tax=Emticicia aquatica TaxID=1681835 RepID=A0ABM9AR79_9BACT|nr:DsbA family protein [Emticicia aquatica]CAH0996369.1 Kynurenine 3-monooxygenase [Emticicia aquatica]
MKIVIIGGGVAGLTLGLLLHKKNVDISINERTTSRSDRGHAFLMHADGWSILNKLGENTSISLKGEPISTFSFNRPNGEEIKRLKLSNWKCFKRKDLIKYLYELLPAEKIKAGREFSHFIYQGEKAIAVQFTNGEIEYGDIFIGADGGKSAVRESILGAVNFTEIQVKEVVGICKNESLGTQQRHIFKKFQSNKQGLSFGMIPVSVDEFVWFMQFDTSLADCQCGCSAEELKTFCMNLLADFPPEVSELLDSNDFSKSYIWNTCDFGVLPTFHKNNIVLIGDAAHLALPFTSAGTTNAIMDAQILSEVLFKHDTYVEDFQAFYNLRLKHVEQHILLGRELKEFFLHPSDIHEDDVKVPLISKKVQVENSFNKEINLQYFSDPICSTCWVVQPLLRKLVLEYGHYINVEHRMGGLLPSWENFNRGNISKPSDVAPHWEEECVLYGMPLDGDIWLENPLNSSYPPSIAFKAAQLQDADLASLFLRRIKEMLFIEKINIVDVHFLAKVAFEIGLDSARFLKDYEHKAKDSFLEDLRLANELKVNTLPTLIFSNANQEQIVTKGHQTYNKLEDIVLKLIPNAKKQKINTTPEYLFNRFSTMTNKEYAIITDTSIENSTNTLNYLFEEGFIDKYESKNGVLWKSKSMAY